jgi:hypothetical protein
MPPAAPAAFVPAMPPAAPAAFVPAMTPAAPAAFVPAAPSPAIWTHMKVLLSKNWQIWLLQMFAKVESDRNEKDTPHPEHCPVSKKSSYPDNIAWRGMEEVLAEDSGVVHSSTFTVTDMVSITKLLIGIFEAKYLKQNISTVFPKASCLCLKHCCVFSILHMMTQYAVSFMFGDDELRKFVDLLTFHLKNTDRGATFVNDSISKRNLERVHKSQNLYSTLMLTLSRRGIGLNKILEKGMSSIIYILIMFSLTSDVFFIEPTVKKEPSHVNQEDSDLVNTMKQNTHQDSDLVGTSSDGEFFFNKPCTQAKRLRILDDDSPKKPSAKSSTTNTTTTDAANAETIQIDIIANISTVNTSFCYYGDPMPAADLTDDAVAIILANYHSAVIGIH